MAATIGHATGWLTVLWIVIFWRLWYPSLLDPDEAHYAQLTREMMRSGEWLVPLLNGMPFIDKPALFHWLQAMSVTVFGTTELAMRLPSALSAVALIATTRWLGARLFDRRIANRAALMFATLPLTLALARVAVFDMIFVSLLFGGVACLLVAMLDRRPRLLLVGYPLITFALMTKGPVALLLTALFVTAIACAGREHRARLARLHVPAGLAFIIVTASPWFVLMWLRFGEQFIREYLIVGNLWYFTEPAEFSTRTTNPTFYVRAFLAGLFPWSLVALGAGIDALREWRAGIAAPPARTLLWIWTVVIVGFFSAAGFKLDYYIFPAAPACALLAASAWDRAAAGSGWRWTRHAVTTFAAVLLVGGIVCGLFIFRLNLRLDTGALLLPLVLVAGGAVTVWQLWQRQWRLPSSIAVPLVTLLATYAVVVIAGFNVLERSRPTAPLGRWIAERADSDAVVGQFGQLDDWRSSIRFYSDRRVELLRTVGELQTFLKSKPTAYVWMLRQDYEPLKAAGFRLNEVLSRPAIVGRTGKFLRRQVWGDLMVVAPRSPRCVDPRPTLATPHSLRRPAGEDCAGRAPLPASALKRSRIPSPFRTE